MVHIVTTRLLSSEVRKVGHIFSCVVLDVFLRFGLLSALLRINRNRTAFLNSSVSLRGLIKGDNSFFFFLQVAVSRVEDRRIFFSLSQMEKDLRTASEEDCFLFSRFRMSVERNWEIGFGAVNMKVFHLLLHFGWNSVNSVSNIT